MFDSFLVRATTYLANLGNEEPSFLLTVVHKPSIRRSAGEIVRALVSLSTGTALIVPAYAEQLSLNDFPAPLVKKVTEIQKSCGSQIVSAYRPGAVTPYGNASEHAFKTSGGSEWEP